MNVAADMQFWPDCFQPPQQHLTADVFPISNTIQLSVARPVGYHDIGVTRNLLPMLVDFWAASLVKSPSQKFRLHRGAPILYPVEHAPRVLQIVNAFGDKFGGECRLKIESPIVVAANTDFVAVRKPREPMHELCDFFEGSRPSEIACVNDDISGRNVDT